MKYISTRAISSSSSLYSNNDGSFSSNTTTNNNNKDDHDSSGVVVGNNEFGNNVVDVSSLSSFEDALCNGYAIDGGLYVPYTIPEIITVTKLIEWQTLSYGELLHVILRYYIAVDEIPDNDLATICTNALQGFQHPTILPVLPLNQQQQNEQESDTNDSTTTTTTSSSSSSNNIYVAELFHGPTYCFKDFGMRVVCNLLSYFAQRRKRSITLVVSTTGDTGPAAVQAVADTSNPYLSILVHYPYQQISDFQRKQLTTVVASNVHIVTFEGGGDDMDKPIKHMLAQQKEKLQQQQQQQQTSNNGETDNNNPGIWTGVNSYNIGRPLVQMVHYIWMYIRTIEQNPLLRMGDVIDFIIPTGAMGNIVGGYIAKCMKLPVRKFVAAVNTNDIVHRAVSNGQFYKSPIMYKTLSDAINIQIPYNFERLLYYLTNENSLLVYQWMTTLEATDKIDLNTTWHTKLQKEFASASINDNELCTVIRYIQDQYNYLPDPHTAVAFGAAIKLGYIKTVSSIFDDNNNNNDVESSSPSSPSQPPLSVNNNNNDDDVVAVIVATASPCKFQESMTQAIGLEGWSNYFTSNQYPSGAKDILSRPEIPPTHYNKVGTTLEESQMEWEQLSCSIIQTKLSTTTRKD